MVLYLYDGLKFLYIRKLFYIPCLCFLILNTNLSAQENMGFEDGTFNGWTGEIKKRSPDSDNITTTPGLLQHCIMKNGGRDPLIPALSTVSPGKQTSCRIGNISRGGHIASIKRSFRVDSSNMIFSYSYAVVLEDPAGDDNHIGLARPHFIARLMDESGNEIQCAKYTQVVQTGLDGYIHHCVSQKSDPESGRNIGCPLGSEGNDGSNTININYSTPTVNLNCGGNVQSGPKDIYYKDWSTVSVALNEYEGQMVTMEFIVADCKLGGHRGYAYVSTDVLPLDVSKPGTICQGKETKQIVAPAGFKKYEWKGPAGGIVSADDIQTITIDREGTYTVTLYPFSDNPCPVEIEYTARPECPPYYRNTILCETEKGTLQSTNVNLTKYYNLVTNNGERGEIKSWHSSYPSSNNFITDPTSFTVNLNDTIFALAQVPSLPRVDTIGLIFSIKSRPNIIFPDIPPVCSTTPPFPISGITPIGGSFSGTDLVSTTGTLSPGTGGEHTVNYKVFNSDGCVDSISKIFTIVLPPTADAGEDIAVCNNSMIALLEGKTTNNTAVKWTGGTGTFNAPTALNASYSGSKEDSLAGSVTLTLTTTDNNACPPGSDNIIITFVPAPKINAGADQVKCTTDPSVILSGVSENFSSPVWSGGKGTFIPDNKTLNVTYTPASEELTKGVAKLALRVAGQDPCASISDSLTLSFINPPVSDAGPDLIVCKNGTEVEIEGRSENSTDIKWTGGNGFFKSDADKLKTTYVIHDNERMQEKIMLTLTSSPNAPCSATEDQMEITFEDPAVVNAGTDQFICDTEKQVIMQGTFSNSPHAVWSAKGSGNFTDAQSMTTEYLISDADIRSSKIDIVLTSSGSKVCSETSDTMTINVLPPPGGRLLPSYKICEDDTARLILNPGASNLIYEWSTGETSQTIRITDAGPYSLILKNEAGCSSLLKTEVKSACPPRLFISDAFSPNENNVNERYHVYGAHIGRFEMFIFNRWGEIIYQSNNFEDSWDGKYLGKKMEIGVYPWIITYEGDSEEYKGPYQKEGSVSVIR